MSAAAPSTTNSAPSSGIAAAKERYLPGALVPATKTMSVGLIEGSKVLGDRMVMSAMVLSCNVCGMFAAKEFVDALRTGYECSTACDDESHHSGHTSGGDTSAGSSLCAGCRRNRIATLSSPSTSAPSLPAAAATPTTRRRGGANRVWMYRAAFWGLITTAYVGGCYWFVKQLAAPPASATTAKAANSTTAAASATVAVPVNGGAMRLLDH